MKYEQRYCPSCKSNKRFSVDAPSGTEDLIWFLLGFVFFPLWFILIWRHMGCQENCDTCGSSKSEAPR